MTGRGGGGGGRQRWRQIDKEVGGQADRQTATR